MRWFKPNIKGGIQAIFSLSRPGDEPATEVEEISLEDIRDAMLALLAGSEDERVRGLTRRIRYASDIQALWFLRGDLMAVLAAGHGETAAREMVEAVSEMFQDLLPRGLRSRPSPLGPSSR